MSSTGLHLFAICNVNIAPLRAEPSHKAEQISQLLFGEKVAYTGNEQGNWIEVVGALDNYKGWVLKSQLQGIKPNWMKRPMKKLIGITGGRLVQNNKQATLFTGSDISLVKKHFFIQDFFAPIVKGEKLRTAQLNFSKDKLIKYAISFLHTPYLWGGKTIAGIDCSGLVQIVFRLLGIMLPRDAWQQAEKGETVYFLSEAKTGDVAFFENEEGRIIHVGILLANDEIIHATESSGRVVIDSIDQEGIISRNLKTRTHKLRVIKRFT